MKTEYKGHVLDSTVHGVDIFFDGAYLHTIETEETGLTEADWIRRGEEWVDANCDEAEEQAEPTNYDYFEFMDRSDGVMNALDRVHGHVVCRAHPEAAAAYEAALDAVYNLYQTAGKLFSDHTQEGPDEA